MRISAHPGGAEAARAVGDPPTSVIAGRVADLRARIAAACRRRDRPITAVRLIAATKGVPPERVAEAVAAGVDLAGENRVQEALPKIAALSARLAPERWHFIGRLQRNKAHQVAGRFGLIHSIDNFDLAETLDRRAAQIGLDQAILIQVRLADEADKGGVRPAALAGLAEAVARLPRLRLRGLMTLPPPPARPGDSRPYFAELARLAAGLRARGHAMDELSMGMSNDFEVAIEEGATLVRIGTAIFGPRSAPAPGPGGAHRPGADAEGEQACS